jgi:hypothetical protein
MQGFIYSAVTRLKTMPHPAPQQPPGRNSTLWALRAHRPLATNIRSVTNQRSSSDTKPFTASRNWMYKFDQGCNLHNVKPYDKETSAAWMTQTILTTYIWNHKRISPRFWLWRQICIRRNNGQDFKSVISTAVRMVSTHILCIMNSLLCI